MTLKTSNIIWRKLDSYIKLSDTLSIFKKKIRPVNICSLIWQYSSCNNNVSFVKTNVGFAYIFIASYYYVTIFSIFIYIIIYIIYIIYNIYFIYIIYILFVLYIIIYILFFKYIIYILFVYILFIYYILFIWALLVLTKETLFDK